MAVDTRNKRASAIGVGLAALLVLPAPDAAIDQGDRQQVTSTYRGITIGGAEPGIIAIIGSYTTVLAITGSAQVALSLSGSYDPVITVTGSVE